MQLVILSAKKLSKGSFNNYVDINFPLFYTHPPSRGHFLLCTWTKMYCFWTTYLPQLVHVVIEWHPSHTLIYWFIAILFNGILSVHSVKSKLLNLCCKNIIIFYLLIYLMSSMLQLIQIQPNNVPEPGILTNCAISLKSITFSNSFVSKFFVKTRCQNWT